MASPKEQRDARPGARVVGSMPLSVNVRWSELLSVMN